ncbi:MAG: YerC/YecD family TrpR-related protein [Monoglobales bacterium]
MFHSAETDALFEAIISINNVEECAKFFEDICTVKELQDLSQRFQVAKLLKSGKSYQEISGVTGASTATISRVNRSLVYGSGGYLSVLSKLEENK